MRQLTQRGDTIVEVLIAIILVGIILGGAFVTVNKSLQSERTAEERSEALELAQGQIESLLGSNLPSTAFCTIGGTVYAEASISTLATAANYSNYTGPAANCIVNNAGQSAPPANQEPAYYHVSVIPNLPSVGIYSAQVYWDRIGGGSQNSVRLLYEPK